MIKFAMRGALKVCGSDLPLYDRVRVVALFPSDVDEVRAWKACSRLKVSLDHRLTVPYGLVVQVVNCHDDEVLWQEGTVVPSEWWSAGVRFDPNLRNPVRVI